MNINQESVVLVCNRVVHSPVFGLKQSVPFKRNDESRISLGTEKCSFLIVSIRFVNI